MVCTDCDEVLMIYVRMSSIQEQHTIANVVGIYQGIKRRRIRPDSVNRSPADVASPYTACPTESRCDKGLSMLV